MIDPWLSYFGHPILPAGYNSWENDGDEIDGAGVNEPIWPEFYDTVVIYGPIVLTSDMLGLFDTECPDYIPPCQDDTVTLPAEFETLVIGRAA